MRRLRKIVGSRVILPVKRRVGAAHRALVFRRAIRQFMRDPESWMQSGRPILEDLIYGWGNEHWSAREDFLEACIRHAIRTDGAILECGSGLSTILIGCIAKSRGQRYWVLEHSAKWATRVKRFLKRYKLDSAVMLCVNPLRDYGDFCWYDPPFEAIPGDFELVICDGPPGLTKGGRYGLVPIMKERFERGCTILLDDAGREQERVIADQWEKELGASLEICGSLEPYIKMTVPATRIDSGRLTRIV